MLVALKLHHTLSLTHEALKSPHMAFDQPPASLPLHTHTHTHNLQGRLALAAGGDGTLRVLDALQGPAVLLLAPGGAALLSCAWSPSRPAMFAAGDGAQSG